MKKFKYLIPALAILAMALSAFVLPVQAQSPDQPTLVSIAGGTGPKCQELGKKCDETNSGDTNNSEKVCCEGLVCTDGFCQLPPPPPPVCGANAHLEDNVCVCDKGYEGDPTTECTLIVVDPCIENPALCPVVPHHRFDCRRAWSGIFGGLTNKDEVNRFFANRCRWW